MRKSLPCRLIMAGTALFLSTMTAFPAFGANVSGHLDAVSSTAISGWAWDSDSADESVTVELTITGASEEVGPGATTVITVPASLFREDLNTALGSGEHGFSYEIDWSKYEGKTYTVTAAAISGDTKTPLIGEITYIKEETTQTSASESQVAVGPGAETGTTAPAASQTEPVSQSSTTLTAEQMAMGPGYMYDASLSKTYEPSKYGPGMSGTTYETGKPDQFLGTFEATAYCGCESCSGGHSLTYSGTVPQANHTLAANLNRFPLGTKLLIDGIVYTVEDTGSSVHEDRIDIFFATHEEALAFGLQSVDIYSVK